MAVLLVMAVAIAEGPFQRESFPWLIVQKAQDGASPSLAGGWKSGSAQAVVVVQEEKTAGVSGGARSPAHNK